MGRKYERGWAALRRRLLQQRGNRCERCGGVYASRRLQVDHLRRVADGGTAADGVRLLCVWCHRSVHRGLSKRRQAVGSGA